MRSQGLNLEEAGLIVIPPGSSIHLQIRIPQSSSLKLEHSGIQLTWASYNPIHFIYKWKRPLGGWELRAWILEPHLWSYLLAPAFNLQTRIPQSSSLSGAQWHSTVFSCLKTTYFIYKRKGHWGDESWGIESWSHTSDHTSWLQHSSLSPFYTRIPQSSSLSGAQWHSTGFSCLKSSHL